MAGLTILISNTVLKGRTGTEIVVRDLALGLKRRGHRPIVFSPVLGDLAQALLDESIPVVDDVVKVAARPDVIHGHHTFETLRALLQFPDTPAIFVCHSWMAAHDEPPITSRVRRYLAVDHTCRDRLVCREGIPPERVGVLGNAVDLTRFPRRGPLPPRPRRGLVFSNYVYEGNVLPAIREGCVRAGLPFDVVGDRFGNFQAAPETVLDQYDIVFGKARCALEAMVAGAAVVVCDIAGFAGLVTTANFDRLRSLNFGYRAQREAAVTPERVADAIARYDAADATRVHERARAEADVEPWLDRLVALYHEVKDDRPTAEDRDSLLAFTGQFLASVRGEVGKFHDVHRQATDLTEWSQLLVQERETLMQERNGLLQERSGLVQERSRLLQERDALAAQLNNAARQRDALAESTRLLAEQRDQLAAELKCHRSSRLVRLHERIKALLGRGPRKRAG